MTAVALRAVGRLSLATVTAANLAASWVPWRGEFADGLRMWADIVDPNGAGGSS